MKLVATIPPRRDGTVVLTTADARITFAPNEHGELVGEVPDEALVARLLLLGGFEPFDEADFDRAQELLEAAQKGEAAADPGDGDDDDDDGDGATAPAAPPIESKTPPKAAAKPKAPARAAKPKG